MGYVFSDLVNIIGDPTQIDDLTLITLTPQDPDAINRTATFEAIISTPGGELTLTIAVREILPPAQQIEVLRQDVNASPRPILPTFTYPPNIIALAPSPNAESLILQPSIVNTTTPQDGIAPIVPIIVLAGLGLIGLLLSRLFNQR
jgi:predicted membrane-bound mannosyltransferase